MTKVPFILTPAKSFMSPGGLEMPVRMEEGTLTFNDSPGLPYVTVTNRSGDKLNLDRDAAAALVAVLGRELNR